LNNQRRLMEARHESWRLSVARDISSSSFASSLFALKFFALFVGLLLL